MTATALPTHFRWGRGRSGNISAATALKAHGRAARSSAPVLLDRAWKEPDEIHAADILATLLIWRDRGMLAFTLTWFSLIGLMSIATEGLARILMCAVSCAGVLATALAYRHKLILTDDRMSLQSWRRFEARRSEITSCHVERSDENGIIWIDVSDHLAPRVRSPPMSCKSDRSGLSANISFQIRGVS